MRFVSNWPGGPAIAKDSKHQTELKVPWGPTVGEVYWIVASRDKDRPYDYK